MGPVPGSRIHNAINQGAEVRDAVEDESASERCRSPASARSPTVRSTLPAVPFLASPIIEERQYADAHCYLGHNPIWEAQGMPATMQGKDMIAYMDRGGVDRVLCAPPGVGTAEPRAHRASLPDRIYGFARVKPPRGSIASDALLAAQRGFHASSTQLTPRRAWGRSWKPSRG